MNFWTGIGIGVVGTGIIGAGVFIWWITKWEWPG